MKKYYFKLNFLFLIFLFFGVFGLANSSWASGTLRINQNNPRYFTDDSGKAILLVGADNFYTFHIKQVDPLLNPAFDYKVFLNNMRSWGLNFFKLWHSERSYSYLSDWSPQLKWTINPLPWARSTVCCAADNGKSGVVNGNKFDLGKWDENYFNLLESRVSEARDAGMYVGIMLFNDISLNSVGWPYHPFKSDNNINSVNGDQYTNSSNKTSDGNGFELHTYPNMIGTAAQGYLEAYVEKVVDSLKNYDNIIYEITNEASWNSYGTLGTAWQEHMVEVIRNKESSLGISPHVVGITCLPDTGYNDSILWNSSADWVSPGPAYSNLSIPANNISHNVRLLPILSDTDHTCCGTEWENNKAWSKSTWAWRTFMRGNHPVMLDYYHSGVTDWYTEDEIAMMKRHMSQVLTYANKINLANMSPKDSNTSISSTGYSLEYANNEYLIYQPNSGSFTVNLSAGTFSYEWFNPATELVAGTGNITVTSGSRSFTPPFSGHAVLYLKISTTPTPYCGDGSCNNNETCSTCTSDCGSCPTIPSVSGWTACASEDEKCNFSGTKEVQYGANGFYYNGIYTDSVLCANSVFGDPLVNFNKYCYYRDVTNSTPAAPMGVRVI